MTRLGITATEHIAPGGGTGSGPERRPARPRPRGLVVVSLLLAGCGLLYALYRGYYGFGGTFGVVGRMVSMSEWRDINLGAAAVLLVLAALPVAALAAWQRPRPRALLLALCWVLATGLVMHSLIMDTQRVLSLAGTMHIRYPGPSVWATFNGRAADLEDLAFNETWFLADGLLWGALAWIALGRSRARRWWTGTALAATATMTLIGLLSAFGVIGRFVVA
jgi:hypothetical protein